MGLARVRRGGAGVGATGGVYCGEVFVRGLVSSYVFGIPAFSMFLCQCGVMLTDFRFSLRWICLQCDTIHDHSQPINIPAQRRLLTDPTPSRMSEFFTPRLCFRGSSARLTH